MADTIRSVMTEWIADTRRILSLTGAPEMTTDALEAEWSNLSCGRSEAHQEQLARNAKSSRLALEGGETSDGD